MMKNGDKLSFLYCSTVWEPGVYKCPPKKLKSLKDPNVATTWKLLGQFKKSLHHISSIYHSVDLINRGDI